jgi:signal transduction histidine kinase
MWRRLSIGSWVYGLTGLLALLAAGGALATMLHVSRVEEALNAAFAEDLAGAQAGQRMESALVRQQSLAAYYFLDADPAWLEPLSEQQRAFESWLERGRYLARGEVARPLFNQVESEYLRFLKARDEALAQFARGDRDKALLTLRGVREQAHHLLGLCGQYRDHFEARAARAEEAVRSRGRWLFWAAALALPLVVLAAGALALFVGRQLLAPARRLAADMAGGREGPLPPNAMRELGDKVRGLLENVDRTQISLRKSREQIAQTEKWATTGKLAAGVAHSIRNPLTSVKIRLYSLTRNSALPPEQKEDLAVISEEIQHIDNVARNFLEFSRPPKLKMQRVSPSDVVDMTEQLVRHRLESYEIPLSVQRMGRLPEVSADPDQLKEVLANLIFNACEAMGLSGGSISISEEVGFADPLGRVVLIRVRDTGPGIPEELQENIFQPFFSSKEEGTGLGLAIAKRIVEEHGGWITVRSKPGEGAAFAITLPCVEDGQWHRY